MLRSFVPAVAALTLAACQGPAPELAPTPRPAVGPAQVDGQRIAAADNEPGNWLTHGRTYSEQRFSPLESISADNVSRLGLAWYYDLPTRRGIEATPLVVDGVMYTTGSWSMVYALNAETGALLWTYDPQLPRVVGSKACCDAVNRGAAVWNGRVYVGLLDGRLVALDAATGEPFWERLTVDPRFNYSITGAPRVVEGKVIIGNGGAELGPIRGYVSAYDATSGELAWRFFTVPGNPEDGFENAAMERAAQTWTGEWWQHGGGGTVWDSMAYDPELGLLYIGVGNGSPWNRRIRSPDGGDNLFLSSIVALKATTGEYVWHYQTTPGDTWDFTATQHIILADLEIDGAQRKVLMQAPKNGFFYVIDRVTGEFISAQPFTEVTWAEGVDQATGRPIETASARYPNGEPQLIIPGPFGGHNWHPMAYSPATGLVFIPALVAPYVYEDVPAVHRRPAPLYLGVNYANFNAPEGVADADLPAYPPGFLSAWDPVAQEERWRVTHGDTWNGGVLATAGGLVFQGTADGFVRAFRATDGDELWSAPAYTGVMAAPVSYAVNGEQYVAVMAGWGGIAAIALPASFLKQAAVANRSRVLVYKLDGTGELPVPEPEPERGPPEPPPLTASVEAVNQGRDIFNRFCMGCHLGRGLIPDLRYSSPEVHEAWADIVMDGALEANGMPGFAQYISAAEAEATRAYVINRARQEREFRAAAGSLDPD
jgi:PQQ-dependent dehydrogenase (methanol/ethanol family)